MIERIEALEDAVLALLGNRPEAATLREKVTNQRAAEAASRAIHAQVERERRTNGN